MGKTEEALLNNGCVNENRRRGLRGCSSQSWQIVLTEDLLHPSPRADLIDKPMVDGIFLSISTVLDHKHAFIDLIVQRM